MSITPTVLKKRTITFQSKSLNIKKTTTYNVVNTDPGLRQTPVADPVGAPDARPPKI